MPGGYWTFGAGGFDAHRDETPEAAEARMEQLISRGYHDVTTTYSRYGEVPEEVKHPGNHSQPQDSWLSAWNGTSDSDCDSAPSSSSSSCRSASPRTLLEAWNGAGGSKKHKK